VQALRTHTARVRDNYHINEKSRKAFVVSQDVPWSEAEFPNDLSLSYLQYPQVYLKPTYLSYVLQWVCMYAHMASIKLYKDVVESDARFLVGIIILSSIQSASLRSIWMSRIPTNSHQKVLP